MKTYMKLNSFLSEYTERNTENKYRPVAVGRYGIRTRESIYSKELAKDYSKNKVIGKNTLTVGMGSVQIDIGILTDDVKYSVSPAYHTYTITGINPDYLRYCLECRNQDMFERYVKRGSRQGKTIDLGRWLTYEIPVGSEINQQEIVSQLDFVESLITARREQLEKLDELVKSRFIELFIGKGYPTKTVDEVSLGKGEYGAQSASVEYDPARPRYVRITDINDDGTLNDDVVASINPADDEQYKLEYGDFMFARMGATVGKTYAFVEGNQIFAGYLIRYKLNLKLINPRYLFWYTKLDKYWNWVKLNQSGAAQPGINAKKFGSLQIPLPSIEEQNKFAAFVEQTDKSKLAIQKSLAELETLKKALMQKYFG
jgi:type I restriction enzyme S subunit